MNQRKGVLDLGGNQYLVATRDGWVIANQNDTFIGQALIRYGEFSGEEAALFRQLVQPGSVVVEVGANIGAHTLSLARLVGPSGHVIAFEPHPRLFCTLCGMIALNGISNISPRQEGLANTAGQLSFDFEDNLSQPHNSGGHALLPVGAGTKVSVQRLDDAWGTITAPDRLDVLKIDVEGMEADVIRGGRSVISRYRPVLYVENDRIANSQELIELLWSLDYDLWWHLPTLYSPDNFFGVAENAYPNIVSVNMLGLGRSLGVAINGLSQVVNSAHHPLLSAG